jgi:hypothetical protein
MRNLREIRMIGLSIHIFCVVLLEEESSKPEIGADAPQRKRARKDTTDTPLTPAKVGVESGSGITTRRSSKND